MTQLPPPHVVRLDSFVRPAGDSDNDVDGHDFLVWQRGQSPNPLSQADLNVWESNFGTRFGTGPKVLMANADTGVEESQPDDIEGNKDRIQVRSLSPEPPDTVGRQNVGYIRFNLAGITTVNDAEFTIVNKSSVGWATGQVQVYGLNDIAGNTPQDWVEAALTYNLTGDELPGDGDQTTQDLGTIGTTGAENLWLLGDLPGVPSGGGFEGIDFSSPELINFLASRANGLATLVLVGANDTNRELQFAPREVTGYEPTLTVNAAHAVSTTVPEPATGIMLMLGMAATMFTGARKLVSNVNSE